MQESIAAAASAGEGLSLEPDAILKKAQQDVGLSDFGDDWFREPLGVFLKSARDEGNLSGFGRFNVHNSVLALLKNRLLAADILKEYPEIHDEQIVAPIIIGGLPRTGTSHLLRLLSSDAEFTTLPYWETLEPILAADELRRLARGEPDPRPIRVRASRARMSEILPHANAMHESSADEAEEEVRLLSMTFSSLLLETWFVAPSYGAWYQKTDQTAAYEYLKTMLKIIQWLRGAKRWVLKSPQHVEQLPLLRNVFPDATVVINHRDPVSVAGSVCTMFTYRSRVYTRQSPLEFGQYWGPRLEAAMNRCVRDRNQVPLDHSIDVHFREFMSDDIAMAERIYAVAGQPFTTDVRDAMGRFMSEHPRGLHGRVRYNLEDVGLDEGDLRTRFDSYMKHFGIVQEAMGE